MRSMSLAEVSSPLATEPKTNAAVIPTASGPKAARMGSTMPTVFMTIPRSSAKIGEAALAR